MQPDTALLAIAGTFVLVVGIIAGAYFLFIVRPEGSEQDKIRRRLKADAGPAPDRLKLLRAAKSTQVSSIAALRGILGKAGGTTGNLQRLLSQAGMDMSVGTLVLMMLCFGAVAFLLVQWTARVVWLSGIG